MREEIRSYLHRQTLLFDGAMGTYWAAGNPRREERCEQLNLLRPEEIERIHRQYLQAGCRAIKTNTFGANLREYGGDRQLLDSVIDAGWRIARQAAGEDAYVFADLGPLPGREEEEAAAEYRYLAERFLRLGARHFLFETGSSAAGLAAAARWIRQERPEAYIIISFAVQPDGYTREGVHFQTLFQQMAQSGAVDAVGLNCVCGAHHMLELARQGAPEGLTLSVMPNSGYPVVRGNRTYYDGDPRYFAQELRRIAHSGAGIIGGCCGTTPEHLRQAALLLAEALPEEAPAPPPDRTPVPAPGESSRFLRRLDQGGRVLAVELDPPKDADAAAFLTGAARLQAAGADILTIADCPVARARMDSSLLACKVQRELGMDALPHMTCRDRNLNAAKALVLGLYAEGVRQILAVTGDPVPTAERDEVKSVYQFNSRKLAGYLTSLNQRELGGRLTVFGALNLNARNFTMELSRAREKLEAGMAGFLTQPVLTQQAAENLAQARQALPGKLLGGILPVVSARNAQYMDSEVNGIRVDPRIIALYQGKSRQEAEELALRISLEIARTIAPWVDGYYLMTPFHRVALMERLIRALREEAL